MRKAAIIAMVGIGSSLALYTSMGHVSARKQLAQTGCCDDTSCCLMGNTADCCDFACE